MKLHIIWKRIPEDVERSVYIIRKREIDVSISKKVAEKSRTVQDIQKAMIERMCRSGKREKKYKEKIKKIQRYL